MVIPARANAPPVLEGSLPPPVQGVPDLAFQALLQEAAGLGATLKAPASPQATMAGEPSLVEPGREKVKETQPEEEQDGNFLQSALAGLVAQMPPAPSIPVQAMQLSLASTQSEPGRVQEQAVDPTAVKGPDGPAAQAAIQPPPVQAGFPSRHEQPAEAAQDLPGVGLARSKGTPNQPEASQERAGSARTEGAVPSQAGAPTDRPQEARAAAPAVRVDEPSKPAVEISAGPAAQPANPQHAGEPPDHPAALRPQEVESSFAGPARHETRQTGRRTAPAAPKEPEAVLEPAGGQAETGLQKAAGSISQPAGASTPETQMAAAQNAAPEPKRTVGPLSQPDITGTQAAGTLSARPDRTEPQAAGEPAEGLAKAGSPDIEASGAGTAGPETAGRASHPRRPAAAQVASDEPVGVRAAAPEGKPGPGAQERPAAHDAKAGMQAAEATVKEPMPAKPEAGEETSSLDPKGLDALNTPPKNPGTARSEQPASTPDRPAASPEGSSGKPAIERNQPVVSGANEVVGKNGSPDRQLSPVGKAEAGRQVEPGGTPVKGSAQAPEEVASPVGQAKVERPLSAGAFRRTEGAQPTVARDASGEPAARQTARKAVPAGAPKSELPAFRAEFTVASVNETAGEVVGPAVRSSGGADEKLISFVRQVGQRIEGLVKSDRTSLEVHLEPEQLGKISLKLVSSPQGTTVVIQAEHASTGWLIEQNLPQLRQSLTEAGVQLNGLSVGGNGAHSPGSQGYPGSFHGMKGSCSSGPAGSRIEAEPVRYEWVDPVAQRVNYLV